MVELDSIFIVEKRVIYKDNTSSVWYAVAFFRFEPAALSCKLYFENKPLNENIISASYRIREVQLDIFEL